jgi:hypothetical protein
MRKSSKKTISLEVKRVDNENSVSWLTVVYVVDIVKSTLASPGISSSLKKANGL